MGDGRVCRVKVLMCSVVMVVRCFICLVVMLVLMLV